MPYRYRARCDPSDMYPHFDPTDEPPEQDTNVSTGACCLSSRSAQAIGMRRYLESSHELWRLSRIRRGARLYGLRPDRVGELCTGTLSVFLSRTLRDVAIRLCSTSDCSAYRTVG